MSKRGYPAPDAPERVKAALAGPSGEVLRLIAAQPYSGTPRADIAIPVTRPERKPNGQG